MTPLFAIGTFVEVHYPGEMNGLRFTIIGVSIGMDIGVQYDLWYVSPYGMPVSIVVNERYLHPVEDEDDTTLAR